MNKILESARTGKLIGSSLEAKVYLHAENANTVSKLKELVSATNDADALHRLFITSEVNSKLEAVLLHSSFFFTPSFFVSAGGDPSFRKLRNYIWCILHWNF